MAKQKSNAYQNGGFWEELGRVTLASAGSSMDLTFTAKKYLKIIYVYYASGGSVTSTMRFNNDSGGNYSLRFSDNGGTENTLASQANLYPDTGGGIYPVSGEVSILNTAANEKLVRMLIEGGGTGGAANIPTRRTMTGKWVNTTNAINRVTFATALNNFAIGSEVVVLGHD